MPGHTPVFEGTSLQGDTAANSGMSLTYLVYDLDDTLNPPHRLQQALDYCPAYGTCVPGMPDLVLVRKRVEPVTNCTTSARVTMEYARIGDSDLYFIFGCRGTLSSIESEKDGSGNQITLTYTFPEDYENEDLAGTTQTVGGKINVMVPTRVITARGIVYCDTPLPIQGLWQGSINALPWAGGEAGTWMCTECSAAPLRVTGVPGANIWSFSFEFQYNLAGHQPTCWFNDPETGEPVPDLVPGESVKTIDWYPQLDFSLYFRDY